MTVEPELQFSWGVTITSRRAIITGTLRRGTYQSATSAVLLLAVILGGSGITVASAGTARADFLGIGAAVEDWLCGVVQPTEPWEAVGDGPESWMSNRNLVGAIEPSILTVGSDGAMVSTPSGQTTAPDTVDQLRALPPGSYTLYELAGLRGLEWWTIPISADGTSRNCSLWSFLWTTVANFVFSGNKILLQIVISIKEAAAAANPLAFLYDASGGVMSDIFSLFFVPIATLMLMLTALWMGIQSVRGKNQIRKHVGAAMAGLAITVMAAFIYISTAGGESGFRFITKAADEMIGTGTSLASEAAFSWMTDGTQACALPIDGTASRGERITSCVLADTLAYRPWAVGQFGAAGANPIAVPNGEAGVAYPDANGLVPVEGWEPIAEALFDEAKVLPLNSLTTGLPCYVNFQGCQDLRTYLIAQHGGVQIGTTPSGAMGFEMCKAHIRDLAMEDRGLTPWGMNQESYLGNFAFFATEEFQNELRNMYNVAANASCSPMFRVFTILSQSDVVTAGAYSGDVGIARVSQAFTALIGTLVAGVAVLLIALITMSWHAMTYVLYLMGPFKLAFAVYAGKMKLAGEWVMDLCYAWISRFSFGVVLTLVILLIVWVFTSTQSFGYRIMWLGVILWLLFKVVGKIQAMIKPGAASISMNPAEKTQEVGQKVLNRSKRSTVGGVDGIRDSAGRLRDKMSDPTRGKVRKTVSALTSPVTVIAGGARGAVTGRSSSERRLERAIAGTKKGGTPSTKNPSGSGPGRTGKPGAKAPRKAGTSNPSAVDARTNGKDVPLYGAGRTGSSGRRTRRAGTPHPSAVDARTNGKDVPPGADGPRRSSAKRSGPQPRVVIQPKARPQSASTKPERSRDSAGPAVTTVEAKQIAPTRRELPGPPRSLPPGPDPSPSPVPRGPKGPRPLGPRRAEIEPPPDDVLAKLRSPKPPREPVRARRTDA